MAHFEIYLKWTGKGNMPNLDDYGFYPNPPICLNARSIREALGKLKIPNNVVVQKIEQV